MGPDACDPLLADQDRDRDMEAAPATQALAPSSWPSSATETRALHQPPDLFRLPG